MSLLESKMVVQQSCKAELLGGSAPHTLWSPPHISDGLVFLLQYLRSEQLGEI